MFVCGVRVYAGPLVCCGFTLSMVLNSHSHAAPGASPLASRSHFPCLLLHMLITWPRACSVSPCGGLVLHAADAFWCDP
jgi:hypothetical protein